MLRFPTGSKSPLNDDPILVCVPALIRMRRLSFWLILIQAVLITQAHAYDGLILRPAGHSTYDQILSQQLEEAFLAMGCRVLRPDVPQTAGGSQLMGLEISGVSLEKLQSRFAGYGINLNSNRLLAALKWRLVDDASGEVMASSDEQIEDQPRPVFEGNSASFTEAIENERLLHHATLAAETTASKAFALLREQGICKGDRIAPFNRPEPSAAIQTTANVPEKVKPLPLTPLMPKPINSQSQPPDLGPQPSGTKIKPTPMHSHSLEMRRVALVIGNSTYRQIPSLINPIHDARIVGQALIKAGFELIGGEPLLDLTRTAMEKAIQDFGTQLSRHPGSVGLVYYAGHGIQVNGVNYLMPVEANPSRTADLPRQMIDATHLLTEMEDSRTGLNILILDACRNNPFGGRGIRQTSTGLAQMQAPRGSMIVYATQPGNIAQDGPPGQNSPFAKALAASLVEPDLDLFGTFNAVGLRVADTTNGAQQPWISSSPIEGRFCFIRC